jgi:prepilin-type N-terminal cleavage/methylation domain-containing protein/prepilin-type processing-associated H-X9-DG protein
MTIRRQKGFTLIELLVVIAIIGILAAMVFPVFARARESARKAVCLSNMKNIALAVNLYLSDYNGIYFTFEHRPEVISYYDNIVGGGKTNCKHGRFYANPYLRTPVILDEYVKNREVWQCPSAKLLTGATVINGCVPDWFTWRKLMYDQDTEGQFVTCYPQYPKGWGGAVTDSMLQLQTANDIGNSGTKMSIAQKAFVAGIGISSEYEVKESQVQDTARYVVAADGGNVIDDLSAALNAYPDICWLDCGNSMCGSRDWENSACVASAAGCGLYNYAPTSGYLLKDATNRRQYARHLGGSNVGFWDGHAQWIAAEKLIDMVEADELQGMEKAWGPRSYCTAGGGGKFKDEYPDVPTLR